MPCEIKRPMLAGKVEDIDKLCYPLIASPKIDGIRCLIIDGVAMSRSFKPIPNEYIQRKLSKLPTGLDGELLSGDTFQACTSDIMSVQGEPAFRYHVFDYVQAGIAMPYVERLRHLAEWHREQCKLRKTVRLVPTRAINDKDQLLAYEVECLSEGFEGVMVRTPNGPYKCGRSTEKEGWLLKLKRFTTNEAIVIGTTELHHNTNEAEISELGLTKRSHAKAGKQAAGTMGTLMVRDVTTGIEFEIGTGFTSEMRAEIWRDRRQVIGRCVTYKHQPYGVKEKPRLPVFLGFRHSDDM